MLPKTLRGALDSIQKMLDGQPYSLELWNVLTALRGPDSRNTRIKYATTAVIRQAAFPKKPTDASSVFCSDSLLRATRRQEMFHNREDLNHFREHVRDAFAALGLQIGGVNAGISTATLGKTSPRASKRNQGKMAS